MGLSRVRAVNRRNMHLEALSSRLKLTGSGAELGPRRVDCQDKAE